MPAMAWLNPLHKVCCAYFTYSQRLFGWLFVKRFALWYRTVVLSFLSVCLSVCLSLLCFTLVYCSQMVGWIKMKLGMEVGLSPGHIVLDGDPALPKGAQPPIFGPCLLWPNGWMDQDATCYGDRLWPRRHCVRWGPSSPLQKGHSLPNFWPMSIVAKRLDALGYHLVWRYALAQVTLC